jgi:hypothetical protein
MLVWHRFHPKFTAKRSYKFVWLLAGPALIESSCVQGGRKRILQKACSGAFGQNK